MKKMFLLTALMFSSIVLAQGTEVANLKSVMKEMSSTLKIITAQASDSSKNAESAVLVEKLIKAGESSRTLFPKSATDKASQDKYQQMIDVVLLNSKDLKLAFEKNQNATAVEILNKLVQNKKDGHAEFKN